ncbi:MAG: prolipoprotein diacylglyceryl transferase [Verrucomicrobiota bacterium]
MEILATDGYWVHDWDPFLIQWSENWGIRYYGLAYLAGFLAVFLGLRWFYAKGWSEIPPEKVGDLLTYGIIGTLAGGRLGYCLLYDWEATVQDPLSMIAFWRGGIEGMASHGGMVGIVLAIWIFARRHPWKLWPIFDNLSLWVTPGLFLGRVANFINGELWGRPTDVPWAVIFPDARWIDGQMVPRHPSQLYQALLEGLLLFIVLFWLKNKSLPAGMLAGTFLAGYGVLRMIGELYREPDLGQFLFAEVTRGQFFSVFLILAGVVVVILAKTKRLPG